MKLKEKYKNKQNIHYDINPDRFYAQNAGYPHQIVSPQGKIL